MTDSGEPTNLMATVAAINRDRAKQGLGPLKPSQVYTDYVWDAADLSTHQKLVALLYADHAGSGDEAWLDRPRLKHRASIGNDRTAANIPASLVKLGWFEAAGHAPGHKQIPNYRLMLPVDTGTTSGTGTDGSSATGSTSPEPVAEVLPVAEVPQDQWQKCHQTGGTSATQLSKTLQDSLSSPAPRSATAKPEREEDLQPKGTTPAHRALTSHGIPAAEQDALIRRLERTHNVRGPAWWHTVASNGSLPGLITADAKANQPRAAADDKDCPEHPGQKIGTCKGCAADRKAGAQS